MDLLNNVNAFDYEQAYWSKQNCISNHFNGFSQGIPHILPRNRGIRGKEKQKNQTYFEVFNTSINFESISSTIVKRNSLWTHFLRALGENKVFSITSRSFDKFQHNCDMHFSD